MKMTAVTWAMLAVVATTRAWSPPRSSSTPTSQAKQLPFGVPPLVPFPRNVEVNGGAYFGFSITEHFRRTGLATDVVVITSAVKTTDSLRGILAAMVTRRLAKIDGIGHIVHVSHGIPDIKMNANKFNMTGTVMIELAVDQWHYPAASDDHGLILSGEEAYELFTSPRKIQITASAISGLRLGITTALQLLRHSVGTTIPSLRMADSPVSTYRGLMIDNVRQPHNFTFHMAMLDHLAEAKLNIYQLHASDDQGYSMPSIAYPSLPMSSALTSDEAAQLQRKAASLGIEIVAEIDMPGHSSALLSKLPQLAAHSNSTGAVCHEINVTNPDAIKILQTLMGEVMQLFPGRFYHLGADEVNFNTDCNMTKETYHAFINTMNNFVRSKNRTMIVWEGFDPVPGTTADNISLDVVVSPFDSVRLVPWHHRPHHYYDAGYNILNTDWNPLYLVHGGDGFAAGPEAIAAWNPTKYGNYPYLGSSAVNWQSLPSDNWNSPGYHSRFTGQNASCWPDSSKHSDTYIPSPYPSNRLLGGSICSWDNEQDIEIPMFFGKCGDKLPSAFPGPGYPRPAPRGSIVGERLWGGAGLTAQQVLENVDCAYWALPPPPPPSPPPAPGSTFSPMAGACRDEKGTYSARLDHEGNISYDSCRSQCITLGMRCDAYDIFGQPGDAIVGWCGVWGTNLTAEDANANFQFFPSNGGRVCHGDVNAGKKNTCFHRPPFC